MAEATVADVRRLLGALQYAQQASVDDGEKPLETVAEQLHLAVPCQRLTLFVPGNEHSAVVADVFGSAGFWKGLEVPRSGILGEVFRTQKHICANDARSDPRFSPDADERGGLRVRSVLVVPILSRGSLAALRVPWGLQKDPTETEASVIGVLHLANRTANDGAPLAEPHFRDTDVRVALQMAAIAGGVTRQQELLRSTLRAQRVQSTLLRLNKQLVTTLHLPGIVGVVERGLLDATAAEFACLLLADKRRRRFVAPPSTPIVTRPEGGGPKQHPVSWGGLAGVSARGGWQQLPWSGLLAQVVETGRLCVMQPDEASTNFDSRTDAAVLALGMHRTGDAEVERVATSARAHMDRLLPPSWQPSHAVGSQESRADRADPSRPFSRPASGMIVPPLTPTPAAAVARHRASFIAPGHAAVSPTPSETRAPADHEEMAAAAEQLLQAMASAVFAPVRGSGGAVVAVVVVANRRGLAAQGSGPVPPAALAVDSSSLYGHDGLEEGGEIGSEGAAGSRTAPITPSGGSLDAHFFNGTPKPASGSRGSRGSGPAAPPVPLPRRRPRASPTKAYSSFDGFRTVAKQEVGATEKPRPSSLQRAVLRHANANHVPMASAPAGDAGAADCEQPDPASAEATPTPAAPGGALGADSGAVLQTGSSVQRSRILQRRRHSMDDHALATSLRANHCHSQPFSVDDVAVVEGVAASAGVSVEKALLFDSVSRSQRRLRAVLDMVKSSSKVSAADKHEMSLPLGAIRAMARAGERGLQVDRLAVMLLDAQADELVCAYSQDVAGVRLSLSSGLGLACHVARTGEEVILADAYSDPRFDPRLDRITGYRTRSVLLGPVRDRRGRVIAVVSAINKRADASEATSGEQQGLAQTLQNSLATPLGSPLLAARPSPPHGLFQGLSVAGSLSAAGSLSPSRSRHSRTVSSPAAGGPSREQQRALVAMANSAAGAAGNPAGHAFAAPTTSPTGSGAGVAAVGQVQSPLASASRQRPPGVPALKLSAGLTGGTTVVPGSDNSSPPDSARSDPAEHEWALFDRDDREVLRALCRELGRVLQTASLEMLPFALDSAAARRLNDGLGLGVHSPRRTMSGRSSRVRRHTLTSSQSFSNGGSPKVSPRRRNSHSTTSPDPTERASMVTRRRSGSHASPPRQPLTRSEQRKRQLSIEVPGGVSPSQRAEAEGGRQGLAPEAEEAAEAGGELGLLASSTGLDTDDASADEDRESVQPMVLVQRHTPKSNSVTAAPGMGGVPAGVFDRPGMLVGAERSDPSRAPVPVDDAEPSPWRYDRWCFDAPSVPVAEAGPMLLRMLVTSGAVELRLAACWDTQPSRDALLRVADRLDAPHAADEFQLPVQAVELREEAARLRRVAQSATASAVMLEVRRGMLSSWTDDEAAKGSTPVSAATPRASSAGGLTQKIGDAGFQKLGLTARGVYGRSGEVTADIAAEHLPIAVHAPTVLAFVEAVRRLYRQTPFHNFFHGLHVCQATFMLLKDSGSMACLEPLERLALLLAALAHDVDHPAVSNDYLVKTESALAMRYNDSSVLENHHAATMFRVLQRPGTDVLSCLEPSERRSARKVALHAILATDMSKHAAMVRDLRGREAAWRWAAPVLGQGAADMPLPSTRRRSDTGDLSVAPASPSDGSEAKADPDDRIALCEVAIHTADICAQALPFSMASQWTERISDEFEQQCRLERERGFEPPLFLQNLDDRSTRWGSQVGFIQYVLTPLWTALADLMPRLQPRLQALQSNQQRYKELAAEAREAAKSHTSSSSRSGSRASSEGDGAEEALLEEGEEEGGSSASSGASTPRSQPPAAASLQQG